MTEEETKIARAFVACARWVWLPGMLTDRGVRISSVRPPRAYVLGAEVPTLPDITDPCTRGGILQVARDATGDPDLHVRCALPYTPSYTDALPYAVYSGRGQRWTDRHNSEAEALLQVLQAASDNQTTKEQP